MHFFIQFVFIPTKTRSKIATLFKHKNSDIIHIYSNLQPLYLPNEAIMAHHYNQRRQIQQMARAKLADNNSSGAGPSSSDDQQNVNNACFIENWNPNQIVYRKVGEDFDD